MKIEIALKCVSGGILPPAALSSGSCREQTSSILLRDHIVFCLAVLSSANPQPQISKPCLLISAGFGSGALASLLSASFLDSARFLVPLRWNPHSLPGYLLFYLLWIVKEVVNVHPWRCPASCAKMTLWKPSGEDKMENEWWAVFLFFRCIFGSFCSLCSGPALHLDLALICLWCEAECVLGAAVLINSCSTVTMRCILQLCMCDVLSSLCGSHPAETLQRPVSHVGLKMGFILPQEPD